MAKSGFVKLTRKDAGGGQVYVNVSAALWVYAAGESADAGSIIELPIASSGAPSTRFAVKESPETIIGLLESDDSIAKPG